MAAAAKVVPKFPWDCDVPGTPFWKGIEYTTARNFLQCFTETEISSMAFDDTVPIEEKLLALRSILYRTFAAREEACKSAVLHEADYQSWVKLKLALSSIAKDLGENVEQENIVREMYNNGPYDPVSKKNTKNMSALHNLSALLERDGDYKEAEKAAREVLPWLQKHELLGDDAPQTLSAMRMIARCAGKQNRWADADSWVEVVKEAVEGMGKGKFAKYQGDEQKSLEELREELSDWKRKHDW